MKYARYIWFLILTGGIASAQNEFATHAPTFDVLSIREIPLSTTIMYSPGHSGTIGAAHKPCKLQIDRVFCQLTTFDLLQTAYNLDRNEIQAPDSANTRMFVLQAIAPPNTDEPTLQRMLQQALMERFHLSFHREDKVIDVYAMVPASGGLKLQPADDPQHRKFLKMPNNSSPKLKSSLIYYAGHFESNGTTLESFAINLRQYAGLDRPVVNRTGRTGEFKIALQWQPPDDETRVDRNIDPNFCNAVEKQLGIHLEKMKLKIKAFVVDHIDPEPTEN